MKRKSALLLLSLILVVSVFMIGCSAENASKNANTSEVDKNNKGAPSSMPDRPFTFISQQIVETIDPAKHTDETSSMVIVNMYDSLVYPRVDQKSLEPGPNIAESWEVSDDGLTYTFKIKEGIFFHSGNELTADDVAFSMKRALALQQGNSWMWSDVLESEGVSAVDNYTVEFKLKKPYAPFVSTLAQLFVVDSKLIMENLEDGEFGEFGDYGQAFLENNTAGSGPYKLEKWERGSEVQLVRFDEYWKGWEDNQIKEVRVMIVGEEATAKTMLSAGEVDMVNQWLSTETYSDLAEVNGVTVTESVDTSIFHIPLNTQKPPLDDINVRKAIVHAFDYETATKEIMNGAQQARGPVSSEIPGHNPESTQYHRDLELAKEYLSKSKYAGEELDVDFMFIGEFPQHRQFATLLQNNLQEIGIKVNLKPDTWANIMEATSSLNTSPHMIIVSAGLRYPHVDAHTYGMYHSSVHGSYLSASWYDNSEVDEILEGARNAVDEDEQMKNYMEAQKIITDDAVSIYIANPTHRIAYRDWVKDYYHVGILGFDLNFYYLKLE